MWQAIFVLMMAFLMGASLFVLVGEREAFVGIIGVLLVWNLYHCLHLHRLLCWLDNKQQMLPKVMSSHFDRSLGGWQLIFDKLTANQYKQIKHKQRLNATIHRLNRMMASLPSALVIVNDKGIIEWKNAKADAYLGLDTSLKMPIKQQIAHEEFHALFDVASSQGVEEVKITLNQKTLLITIIPIESGATMLIASDISATEQLHNSKSIFIANVSHELRTPLTVIQGFLEMLENDALEQELRREFVGLMQKEALRMMELIEGLLTLSRLENDQHNFDTEPVCLSQMIMGICTDVAALSDGHCITSHICPDVWVDGVYKELYSVFSNLIVNAIRHTEHGTQIEVNLFCDDDIVFVVKDDGEGIASEHLVHLTERFYRVDQGRSRKTGGSGLGLAIAKHAVARHDGVLSVESCVGEGSVFTVRLPKSANHAILGST